MKLANSLVNNAVTKNANEEYLTKLENICICSYIKSWIDFWHKRHFHFVSAFRGFFLPGVNLLALVDAAHKDISAQMHQDELYRATIENCTSIRGWACTQAQKQADEHWAQESPPNTLLICKMEILGCRKQLLKISMNLILMRIPALVLAQHAN